MKRDEKKSSPGAFAAIDGLEGLSAPEATQANGGFYPVQFGFFSNGGSVEYRGFIQYSVGTHHFTMFI
jgi:hypothetical protein